MESITKGLALRGELFEIERQTAFLIPPASRPAGGLTPWVWYAPTLLPVYPDDLEEWMFRRFLDHGIAVAGIDVGESYGSPADRGLLRQSLQGVGHGARFLKAPGLAGPQPRSLDALQLGRRKCFTDRLYRLHLPCLRSEKLPRSRQSLRSLWLDRRRVGRSAAKAQSHRSPGAVGPGRRSHLSHPRRQGYYRP